jgi:Fe-S cluster biogenesis protein NfuA
MSSGIPVPIDTVPTPNPDAIMLKVQETLVQSGTHEFTKDDDTEGAPLAALLLAIDGVELVLIAPRFVTLRKQTEREWPDLIPDAKQALRTFMASGEMAVLETEATLNPTQVSEIEQHINRLLDEEIRPAVAMDGGDINYVGFENGIVQVQMAGACGSCPSSTATLKMGVERLLMEEIPEVRGVEQI